MNKWFRWYGFVSFVSILGALIGIVWLSAGWMISWTAERGLSRANQAEVNIAKVDWQLSPLTVTLSGVEFTNPNTPTQNRVELAQSRFELSLVELFRGRVLISDIQIAGVRFDTPRAQAGWVRSEQAEAARVDWRERLAAWNIELPSQDNLVERLALDTERAADTLKTQFEQRRTELEEAREELPTEEELKAFRDRFQAIIDSKPETPAQLLAAREQLSELKDDVRVAQRKVEGFVALAQDVSRATQQDFNALQTAVQEDMENVRQLLSVSPDQLPKWSGILFGPAVETWVARGTSAFQWLAPKLQKERAEEQRPSRWEGRYVDFNAGSPSFLIEQARINFAEWQGALDITLNDITHQHDRLGKPTTFAVNSSTTEKWQALSLSGELSLTEGALRGAQQWQVRGFKLAQFSLLNTDALQAVLESATLDMTGNAQLSGMALAGSSRLNLSQTDFNFAGEHGSVETLARLFNGIQSFSLNVGLSGEATAPGISLNTDLDNQLAAAFFTELNAVASARLRDAEGRFNALLSEVNPDNLAWIETLKAQRAQGQNTQEALQEILSAELNDLLESERERALRKLRERLGGN